jgi:hypothetical protein
LAQTGECSGADRYGKDSEGRNSNAEHLKTSKEKQRAQKKRKDDEGGPDDPEYGAGKHYV